MDKFNYVNLLFLEIKFTNKNILLPSTVKSGSNSGTGSLFDSTFYFKFLYIIASFSNIFYLYSISSYSFKTFLFIFSNISSTLFKLFLDKPKYSIVLLF